MTQSEVGARLRVAATVAALGGAWALGCDFDLGRVKGEPAVGGANTGGASTGGASTGGNGTGGASTGGNGTGGASTGGSGTGATCPDCAVCGDGECEGTETYSTCPSDCRCGDGLCEAALGESSTTCPADCPCGDGVCDIAAGESNAACPTDCFCGNGVCEAPESCDTCLTDCPAGGTVDCYDNGLHANCCHDQNSTAAECLACEIVVECSLEEYEAYCDRFSPGDNLWQQLHRGWVEEHCGGTAVSDGEFWTCRDASCVTYQCRV